MFIKAVHHVDRYTADIRGILASDRYSYIDFDQQIGQLSEY